jgi:hypothetical protein
MGHPSRDDGNRAGGHAALPASRLREVNRILENTAWGSYRTEFYPTYDYKAIGVAAHEKASNNRRQAVNSAFRLRTRAMDCSIADVDRIPSRRLSPMYSATTAISCS